MFTPASPAQRVKLPPPTEQNRGDGPERLPAKSPVGPFRPAPRPGSAANRVPPLAQMARDSGAPVSGRHRAGARNPHRRRRPTPISRPGAPVFRPASRGSAKPAPTTLRHANLTRSAGLRPASRGSAKPAPTTPPHPNLTPRSAGLRPASRGSAKPAPTTPPHPNLTPRSAGLRPASRGSAKPAPMTLRPAKRR